MGIHMLLAVSGASAAELTYTDNLLAWYKADAGVFTTPTGTTPSGNGDPVGRWEDQSGSDYHLTRITESEKPLVDAGAGPRNSTALHFNGDDYLLLSTEGTEATTVNFPAGTELGTVFMVFRPTSPITSSSSEKMLLAVSGGAHINSLMLGLTTGLLTDEVITIRDVTWNPTSLAWQNQASGLTGGYSIPNVEYTFLSLTHAGDAFEIRSSLGGDDLTNGKSGAPGPDGWTDYNIHGSADPNPTSLMTLLVGGVVGGGIGRFDGYISEIIVYKTALIRSERELVEDYLYDKYVFGASPGGLIIFGRLEQSGVWECK